MDPMASAKTATEYVTLSATGNGSVQFTARKSSVITTIEKLTVEVPQTSSGTVSLRKNGGFITSMPVARRMEARGDQPLYSSEYLTVQIENGPANLTVKVVFFYRERPTNP